MATIVSCDSTKPRSVSVGIASFRKNTIRQLEPDNRQDNAKETLESTDKYRTHKHIMGMDIVAAMTGPSPRQVARPD